MKTERLWVELYGEVVGELVRNKGGGTAFYPEQTWVRQGFSPRLGLGWLLRGGNGERRSNTYLPEWFENLLPEEGGALRRLLADSAGLRSTSSFTLLARLGVDLPGAVVVRPAGELTDDEEQPGELRAPGRLRFSLAGMQLKFAVSLRDDKVVLPARGEDGHWIVKLATRDIPELAEVEAATLGWARACGFPVPEHRLVPVRRMERLAHLTGSDGDQGLVIRRYDRTEEGRVHQEDFAQVLELMPSHKYSDSGKPSIGHEGMARLVRDACGEEALLDYLRRIVFVIASGNTDAHLKNWSLMHPRQGRPRLTPLYDQVCVVAWPEMFGWSHPSAPPELALSLGGSRGLAQLDIARFDLLAQRTGMGRPEVRRLVLETLERIYACWPLVEAPARMREAISEHTRRVPLLRRFAS
jgi:serine/threonine-protein kinase HipA